MFAGVDLRDAPPDPIGTAMAALPPGLGLLGLAIPLFALPAQILIWISVSVLIGIDARHREEISATVWVAASVCAWPLALLGYAFERRSKGGPGNVSLVIFGLVIWLAAWFI